MKLAFATIVLAVLAAAAGAVEPPQKVKYTLERGDVTFDHAAHLARRESCRSCHGNGPARKLELEKKSAHTLCIGCHLRLGSGPKACGACHVSD